MQMNVIIFLRDKLQRIPQPRLSQLTLRRACRRRGAKQKISLAAAVDWQNLPLQPGFSIYEYKNLSLYFYWRGKGRPMEWEWVEGREGGGNSSGWTGIKIKLAGARVAD